MKKIITCIVSVMLVLSICIGLNVKAASKQAAKTTAVSSNKVEYYFPRAGQKPEPELVSLMSSAKSSLDVAIYSFTDANIANAIINDKKRGIAVRVISDKSESSVKSQKAILAKLKAAKIPIKINRHPGLMHLKMTIVDKSVATTGSFNYTTAAETENDEVFVVLKNVTVAKDFDSEFSAMWNDSRNYSNY